MPAPAKRRKRDRDEVDGVLVTLPIIDAAGARAAVTLSNQEYWCIEAADRRPAAAREVRR